MYANNNGYLVYMALEAKAAWTGVVICKCLFRMLLTKYEEIFLRSNYAVEFAFPMVRIL